MARTWRVGAVLIGATVAGAAAAHAQAGPNPYRPVPWGELPAGRAWGPTSAIDADPDGLHLWVAERCGPDPGDCIGKDDVHPVLKLDPEGTVVAAFGAGLMVWPHGIHVDPQGNVWVADGSRDAGRAPRPMGYQVLKFGPTGELLMTLGTAGVPGDGPAHFDAPTNVAVAPNGDVFVADGHAAGDNNRIVKFSADGRYLMEWGGAGTAHGQFLEPHALEFDSRGRLFVGDRGNNRIQIFDQEGNLLSVWTQFGKPSGIFIGDDDVVYVADSESAAEHRFPNPGWERGIRIGDARTGWVREFILWDDMSEDPARDYPGPAGSGAEGVAADAAGNVYGAIVRTPRVQKYVRIRP